MKFVFNPVIYDITQLNFMYMFRNSEPLINFDDWLIKNKYAWKVNNKIFTNFDEMHKYMKEKYSTNIGFDIIQLEED